MPVVETEQKIDQDRLEWNKNFLETELASRERDLEIIDDAEAKNQVDLLRSAIDPSDVLATNEEVDQTDYNRTEQNEPLGLQLDPNVLNVMKEIVKNMSEQVNSIYDDMPALEDEPETKYTPPEFVRPNLQDILTGDITEDEIKQEIDELRQETGDILEDIMPEIFTDEPFDDSNFVRENIPELRSDQNRLDLDVRANVTTALVPAEVTIETKDPIDVLGNPNVSNILPPIANENFNFMKTENADNDDDIDFDVADSKIIWDEDNKDLVPLELDDNKIVLTDDGDVILVEPDNMLIEEKPIMPLSEGVVAFPPEEEMELAGTPILFLKRKQPNNEIGKIKEIRNETDILVRDVKPDVKPQELTVALPPSTEVVKHPIYRKLEKKI